MTPHYYAMRLVNPYRGVVQVVDAGSSVARTMNGLTWHLSADHGNGLFRQAGIWEEDRGLLAGRPREVEALLEAIGTRPVLPFPMLDDWEFWLLDHSSGNPLALLATDRQADRFAQQTPEWLPFVNSYQGFHSPILAERDALAPHQVSNHRIVLARLVNRAARPNPLAQWFQRNPDGSGVGAAGVRIPADWNGRQLAAGRFPELLVKQNWNSRLENSVIADYHAHLSPLLLLWPRLAAETRSRLELLACDRPEWLARIQRLLPVQLQPVRIRAALVAARLNQALSGNDHNWIED